MNLDVIIFSKSRGYKYNDDIKFRYYCFKICFENEFFTFKRYRRVSITQINDEIENLKKVFNGTQVDEVFDDVGDKFHSISRFDDKFYGKFYGKFYLGVDFELEITSLVVKKLIYAYEIIKLTLENKPENLSDLNFEWNVKFDDV